MGLALYKRATFSNVAAGSGAEALPLAPLAFTPAAPGTALLRGRGYCAFAATTGRIVVTIAARKSAAVADAPAAASAAVLAADTSATTVVVNWSTESELAVQSGTPVAMALYVSRLSGTGLVTCTGSFTAELFAGVLP